MICKNCNKEMGNNAAFCPECGAKAENVESIQTNQINPNAFQSAMMNSDSIVVKKKYPTKLVVIIVIIALIVIVGLSIVGGIFGGNVIEADNYNGMCFDYGISEWCDSFNEAMGQIEDEIGIDGITLKESSFQLDETDYDPTDACIVRYVYSGCYQLDDDFAISLYVDTETDTISKCEVVYYNYTGDDLSEVILISQFPSLMATAGITEIDEARSIVSDDMSQSSNHSFYDTDTCILYQVGGTAEYSQFSIQAVSQDVYEEKY